jgi:hypothetical protein
VRRDADASDTIHLIGQHDVVDLCAPGVHDRDAVGQLLARGDRILAVDVGDREHIDRLGAQQRNGGHGCRDHRTEQQPQMSCRACHDPSPSLRRAQRTAESKLMD